MGHDHGHRHGQSEHKNKGLTLAFILNLSFTIVEIIGGFLTNSVAILSDAIHDLGDSVALGLAWYFERIGRRGRDRRHSYGYKRYHLLGSIINALVLVAGSVLVITEAVRRLSSPEPVHAKGMILLAVLGIIMNGIAFRKLDVGHSHNVEVVRLHLLEDILGWVAVLLGAIAMLIWDIPVLDPVLSLLIAVFILWQVLKRLRESVRLVMQGVPPDIDLDAVSRLLTSYQEVSGVHDLHLWSMDGAYHILTVHVTLSSELDLQGQAVLKGAMRQALHGLGIAHATLELERAGDDCVLEDC